MSKKVTRRKKAKIHLEPDGFSIHTFELSIQLSKSEWSNCKDRLYTEKSRTINAEYIRTNNAKDIISVPVILMQVFVFVWNAHQMITTVRTTTFAW